MSSNADVGPIQADALTTLLEAVFAASGADARDRVVVADAVVDAELRGIRSQGLLRVANYVASARAGKVRSPTDLIVERDAGASFMLDAAEGWPQPALVKAFELCGARARDTGSCFAVIRRTGHIGRLGYFVERVARRGQIGIVMAGGNKGSGWVAPWGGTGPLWGTNPVAFGFPRRDGEPIVIDISTTQTSRGNVLMAQRLGQALPVGFGLDAHGEATTDPAQALPPHGTLAPLGGQEAGHKGYGLALMVHILCGVLGGSYPGGGGNFLGVLEIGAFGDRASYDASMEALVADIKTVPRKASVDEIYLPGEHSARYVERHRREGLTFPASQWAELTALARDLGVSETLIPATA